MLNVANIKLFLFLAVLFILFQGSSQYLNFNTYSVEDGLAQSQVYSVEEDDKGYIWLATQGGGVSRFDGIRFRNFTIKDGLHSNFVNALFFDENQKMWIGSGKGVNVYTDSLYKIFYSKEVEVFDIEMYNGEIVFGTSDGLLKHEGDSLVSLDQSFQKSIFTIESAENQLYLGGENGVYTFEDGQVLSRASSNYRITSLLFYKNSLLVGTYGNNLLALKGTELKTTKISQAIYGNVVLSLHADHQNKLWIGTQQFGVYAFKNNLQFEHFDQSNGLSNNHVRYVFQDSWNNIWLGTSGGGVSRYNGALFSHYNKENGLNESFVYDVIVDYKKRVWVSTSGLGINVMTDSSTMVLNGENTFHNVKVRSLYEDSKNNIWIGTEGKGISFLPKGSSYMDTLIHYDRSDGLSGNWVRSFEELDSLIYIGTAGGGITRAIPVKGKNGSFYFEPLRLKNGQFPKRINALLADYKKRLWIASEDQGIYYLKSGLLKKVKLPVKDAIPRSLMIKDSILWIGTAENGVFKCRLNTFPVNITAFQANDQLLSSNIYLIQNGVENDFWVGTEKGVNRVFVSNGEYEVTSYGINEGFTGIETCRNASYAEPDGRVWFGTVNGLTVYHPIETYYSSKPPKLHIKDVKLFYQSFSNSPYAQYIKNNYWINQLELPYHDNHISFEFDGIDQSQPLEVEYSFKLEGYEDEWSPWSERDIATYSNLSPGQYTFKLKTRGYSGARREVDPIRFTILPPFWKTWWFVSSLIVFSVLILSLISWRIYSRVRAKNQRMREALEKDKMILELEQKALRLQMNPHFIFHVLNAIRDDYKKGREDAENHLIGFSKLMRKVLENSQKQKISIEEEIEMLEIYLNLNQQVAKKHFEYVIQIDSQLEVDMPVLPPLLLQPFIENSIIHGFNGLDSKGKIEVTLSLFQGKLLIRIIDNGIGREASMKKQHQKEIIHKSAALEITQQRLEALDHNIAKLEIEDIILNGSVNGTSVQITLPLD